MAAARGAANNSTNPSLARTVKIGSSVATPMMDPASMLFRDRVDLTPLNRAARPEEIAQVVLFLASDAARFLTGIDLAADGGFSKRGVYDTVWKRLHAAS